jgi:methionyl aminopeptidase
MVSVKTRDEIERMREAGRIVGEILKNLASVIAPGISTKELENLALYILKKRDARSAFAGYRGYPAAICTSLNEEVVHGIPSQKRVLKAGDIVSIDVGVELHGYYADAATTVGVGTLSAKSARLVKATHEALREGIGCARPRNTLGDVSYAIQNFAKTHGFEVVKSFVGHGIGTSLHEDPEVPNFGKKNTGIALREGMTLAIEPMLVEGDDEVVIGKDGWTVTTKDKKLSAHFEHTVAITEAGPEILTLS